VAYHVAELGNGFADAVAEELDFTIEARNLATIAAAALAGSPVLIPAVHADISSPRPLVMDCWPGI
jgi:ubiquinone biosynthesis protein